MVDTLEDATHGWMGLHGWKLRGVVPRPTGLESPVPAFCVGCLDPDTDYGWPDGPIGIEFFDFDGNFTALSSADVKYLKSSDLHRLSGNVDQIDPIPKSVRGIDIADSGLVESDLEWLSPCENLEFLDLSGLPICGKGFGHLTHLNRLTTLVLDRTYLDDESLAFVPLLPNLQCMSLQNTREITPLGVGHLSRLPRLQQLYLSHLTKFETAADMEPLLRCETLTSLSITTTDEGLEALAAHSNLQKLMLKPFGGISAAGLAHLKQLSKLCDLSLQGISMTPKHWAALSQLTSLETLAISDTVISEAGMESITQLVELRELWLKWAEFDPVLLLNLLKRLPRLERLFVPTEMLNAPNVTALKQQWLDCDISDKVDVDPYQEVPW